MRLDVVVNLRARLPRERPWLVERLRMATAGVGAVHAVATLSDLERIANGLAVRGSDLVAIVGGDGSHGAAVTALLGAFGEEALPPVALVPGGTMSMAARTFGGAASGPVEFTRRLVEARGRVLLRERPTLRVRARQHGEEESTRVGFTVGTGLVARFFELYEAQGARGTLHAARIVARVFAGSFLGARLARRVLDPLPCRLEVDGAPLSPRAWSLVCASVLPELGLGLRLTYRAGEDPLRPHLVASPLPATRLGPQAPRVLAGRPLRGPGVVDSLCGRFLVRFDEEGAGDGPYVIDGDLLTARELEVTAGPVLRVASFDPP